MATLKPKPLVLELARDDVLWKDPAIFQTDALQKSGVQCTQCSPTQMAIELSSTY